MSIFFSHRLELLAQRLSAEIYPDSPADLLEESSLLTPTIVLVPSDNLRQWLMIQLARGGGGSIAGCKILTLYEGLQLLLPSYSGFTAAFCSIFSELSADLDPEIEAYLAKGGSQIDLTDQLAALFLKYSEHGQALVQSEPSGWQHALFKKLTAEGKLRLLIQSVSCAPTHRPGPIHCFGFDFLPRAVWDFLSPFASIYLFSPCRQYWEDLCSDRERRRLGQYWKKRGAPEHQREELDDYLKDAPPLLANWGRLGRETLKVLDRFEWDAKEDYTECKAKNGSALDRLKQRLLDFAAGEGKTAIPDGSIRLHKAGSSRLTEIEHLRRSILQLIGGERLSYCDIAVLAPDIQPYVPLIKVLLFDLPYRIFGVDRKGESPFYQGMAQLFELAKGSWQAEDLLSLFENPAFSQAAGWKSASLDTFREWLLAQKSDDAWEERLLHQVVFLVPSDRSQTVFSSIEQAEQWISILQALRKDLAALAPPCTLVEWAERLRSLAEAYLSWNPDNEADAAQWELFQKLLRDFEQARENQTLFPFAAMQKLLQRPAALGQIHPSHLHAIRFGSLREGEILPAKALFLIGMNEDFPRRERASSLDLLRCGKEYLPNVADADRYCFLRALFAAEEFFHVSYLHLSEEGRTLNPSLLVEELASALDAPIVGSAACGSVASAPPVFPWPVEPCGARQEREFTIPLKELSSLARHPWKFYLQKRHGIYLPDSGEESFAREKASLLRGSLHGIACETAIPGMCGEALKGEVLAVEKERARQMEVWNICLEPVFFRLCCETRKRAGSGWHLPPLRVFLGAETHVHLTGEVMSASPLGFIHTGDDSLPGLLKAWAECLAALIAANRKEIFFLKTGVIRVVENPEEEMKKFLLYYQQALSAPSPLLTEWADAILQKDAAAWDRKMRDRIAEKGVRFEDPVWEWIFARTQLPNAAEWSEHWGGLLRESFSGLTALYPKRGLLNAPL